MVVAVESRISGVGADMEGTVTTGWERHGEGRRVRIAVYSQLLLHANSGPYWVAVSLLFTGLELRPSAGLAMHEDAGRIATHILVISPQVSIRSEDGREDLGD